ncbi:uncharacterized protein LOC115741824 [Rhodamnia argentea]|uniref:Uncharacterized protein LOC115741824 n=1 Tax=Rhodamnia argentea TaxID=178133 RepID=A0A8B8PAJ3_9MYRT|nr:uncharacterized protein LOC115741824 [Rhodamnia argentea]
MGVKMMRWRPWPPPPATRKYEVRLAVRRLEGCDPAPAGEGARLAVEIRWKGPRAAALMRRVAVRRNFTREERVGEGGVVEWGEEEEFATVCSLSAHKDNAFHPWEVGFTVFNAIDQPTKNKVPVVGAASLNLAEFACATEHEEFELSVPLVTPGGTANSSLLLCIVLSLVELRTTQETTIDMVQTRITPVASPPPQSAEAVSAGKDELSALKAGLKKVKIFTEYVSTRRTKKACHRDEGSDGRYSGQSEDCDNNYTGDSDSFDDTKEGELDESKGESGFRNSFSYGTLAYANCAGGSFYSSMRINADAEDWVYYSNHKSDFGSSLSEDLAASTFEQSQSHTSRRGLLSWRKRKLSFRSPKAKGEPLLKKAYAEEGGDDIDFARRQLSSDESLSFGWSKTDEDSSGHRSSVSEFGDDKFAVGAWEQKEIISRDEHMKLKTQVFFASIDQRSELAAGESACTALVAVIADWFQNNRDLLPIKSQLDSLIRDGSLEWRNLCENEMYQERFPDKHFDLETVLQAKIRPLSVDAGKSFIGFFRPECMKEGKFDVFDDAMSFDDIWEEISKTASQTCEDETQVYIVSWNDHFFVLKVEPEAYYIIDTLGERLYEGCTQAFILKFDHSASILKLPPPVQTSGNNTAAQQNSVPVEQKTPVPEQIKPQQNLEVTEEVKLDPGEPTESHEKEEVLCQGKESCKEYIKNFLAAIPIRELQDDLRKGLIASTPLHHRLQIELHYTKLLQSLTITPAEQMVETAQTLASSSSSTDSLMET